MIREAQRPARVGRGGGHRRGVPGRDTPAPADTARCSATGSLKRRVRRTDLDTPIDLDAPAVRIDISAVTSAGDTLLSAAMLSTWSYGFAVIDAATALAEAGLAPASGTSAVLDELWRALRGAPGLVDHADALTRVYRGRDVAHMMMTHSLDDLNALPTEADRAKARGFIDRVRHHRPRRPAAARTRRSRRGSVPLSDAEKSMVASWSSPETWQPGARHPGRGKYLIKTGQRVGIPGELEYVADEADLYNTDSPPRRVVPVSRALGPIGGSLRQRGSALHHPRRSAGSRSPRSGLSGPAAGQRPCLAGHGWQGPRLRRGTSPWP